MITKQQQDELVARLVGKTVNLPYSGGTMVVDGLDLPDDLEGAPQLSDALVYGTVTPLKNPPYPTMPTEPYEGWAHADQVKVIQ